MTAIGRGSVTATVTGETGPDQSLSSVSLTDVKSVNLRFADGVVDIVYGSPEKILTIEASDLQTITVNTTTRAVVLSTS